ncbi:MAG: ABC transporter ATP-binding protein [Candidatus Bathyarchaeota archaeon]|nr:ABC transporter ATP-binding protein [Candidatus Bathyarchaeota archaeon]MDH5733811.1 ABC transporter ATP-binding protein [Candidatus Bathyarchaeota archaeon]
MEFIIETTGLTKKYGSLVAVDKLDLKVEANTIHGFLGPNGAGKTTTIKVLVGLLKPDGGSVSVLGQEIGWDKPDVRSRIGYMPELPKLPKHLKGRELLDIYGRMQGMTAEERGIQIPKLLDMVDLRERENDLIGEYSKGMQQRLGLAQALIGEPKLVILDEPSLGLDPGGMVEVREIMKEMAKEGVTIFLSSHLLHEVQQVCTHVTIINKGVVVTSGTLKQVSAKARGPLTVEAEVDKLSKAVIEKVKELPYVTSVIEEGKRLSVEVETRDDIRSEVSQAITAGGGIVISMNLKGESLEDIFMDLLAKHKRTKEVTK